MPKFQYTAVDADGAASAKGTEDGRSTRTTSALLLAERGLLQPRGHEDERASQVRDHQEEGQAARDHALLPAAGGFIRAGIPIIDALDSSSRDDRTSSSSRRSTTSARRCAAARRFSDAVAAHAEVFPAFYLGILRSAELTGNLDAALDQLADYLERDIEARQKVKSALIYPLIVLVMALVVVVVLTSSCCRGSRPSSSSFHAKLPLPTRMLLVDHRTSSIDWWWLIVVGHRRARRGVCSGTSHRQAGRAGADAFLLSCRWSATSCGTRSSSASAASWPR